jgi:ribosomal peptide maturation radical SAM protein 1
MTRSMPFDHVALISMPWPLFDRPSIQLGVLKAFLRQQIPEVDVRAHHLYLQVAEAIGYNLYKELANRSWAAECVYGGLLFPERRDRMARLYYRKAAKGSLLKQSDYQVVLSRVQAVTDFFIRDADLDACGLIGFSACYSQLTSSLYLMRQIKSAFPKIPVVVGGSLLAGETGPDIFCWFPEIDYLVQGEGEQPMVHLVNHIRAKGRSDDVPDIPGLLTRQKPIESKMESPWQIIDMDSVPAPDFDDYFAQLKAMPLEKRFFPILPAEMSRGCWWCSSKTGGCKFCNLNRQWTGYRAKSPAKVRAEVDYLTNRHQVLRLAFMDNLLPVHGARNGFSELAGLKKDLDMFGEIRATTSRRRLEEMKSAGFREVQIGIEALSTSLLEKMNKGVSAIDNLEIMRNCEELGLIGRGNLIIRFPGSVEADAAETLRVLGFAMPFRPLSVVNFWLGLGSPVWRKYQDFGLKARFNHPNYGIIFPSEIYSQVRFPIQAYRGGVMVQRKTWSGVETKVDEWRRQYWELRSSPTSSPILNYADGGNFLIIRQRRSLAEPLNHRLTGVSREVYLFCRKCRKFEHIQTQFPGLVADRLLPFLRMMVDKKLMFEEDGRYLSLAIRSL